MSKYVIDSSTLTSIADAVRAKTGKTATIKVSDIPTEISKISGGGGSTELPDELIHYTGDCSSMFTNKKWNWVIEKYGNKITTENITNAKRMFNGNETLTKVPFQLNFSDSKIDFSFFCTSGLMEEMGILNNLHATTMQQCFFNCYYLKKFPTFTNLDLSNGPSASSLFQGCYSIRSIPENFTDTLGGSNSNFYSSMCYYCYSLDELTNLSTNLSLSGAANFRYIVDYASRLKRFTFRVQSDGTPNVAKWKNIELKFNNYTGYCKSADKSKITGYNSGITADKEVTDDATYQALKNDPDWFTCNIAYSRYNHNSAVETINSLPDTSAYLSSYGGTNTIFFKGEAGSATDGGAINTLTETEVAVATAKGWTVSIT